jgi:hypothetical protein
MTRHDTPARPIPSARQRVITAVVQLGAILALDALARRRWAEERPTSQTFTYRSPEAERQHREQELAREDGWQMPSPAEVEALARFIQRRARGLLRP